MKKIFNLFIVLLPILNIYRSPIPQLDMATFLVVPIFFLIIFLRKGNFYFYDIRLILLLAYIFVSTPFNLMMNTSQNVTILLLLTRTLRYILLIFILIVLGNDGFFDMKIAIKYLRIITLMASIFIVIQFISFNFMGIVIKGVYYPLRAIGESEVIYSTSSFYRPSAFFLEPSHFVQYIVVYLIYCLLGSDLKKRNIIDAIVITLGVLFSTSGIGYAVTLGIWGLFLLNHVFKSKPSAKNIILVIATIILFSLVINYIIRLNFVQTALDRVFTSNVSGGNAIKPRVAGYNYFFDLPIINKLFGVGFGNVASDIYMNSIAYFLYCTGICGTLILFSIFFNAFIKTHGFYKILCLVVFAMSFTGDVLGVMLFCYYFSFIYSGFKIKKCKT